MTRLSNAEYERLFGPLPAAPKKPGAKAPAKDPALFLAMCAAHGLPEPVPEYRFCERGWRFDWAWPNSKPMVALEQEGAVWTQGRHTRGKGVIEDMAKYNRAAVLGWSVIRCTPQQIADGSIFPTLVEAVLGREK